VYTEKENTIFLIHVVNVATFPRLPT